MVMVIDGTNGLTFPDTSKQYNSYYSFKNRIINGGMVIDQRNAGASVTPTNGQYITDRFGAGLTQASKYTEQQNAGSVTPPAGFTNYLGITSSSAYSILSTDAFWIYQAIEGFNFADLAFGTANAATVTLSFWVRSSLTGTFGGSLQNYARSRSYPFSYTISAANTWEQKSITITGDTSGTWVGASNAGAAFLNFGLGIGSITSGTAGAWASADYRSATGATSVVGTNAATFYITGVQLEKGTQATSFDYRPYGTELALCQRYYEICGTPGGGDFIVSGYASASSQTMRANYQFKVNKRTTTPTMTVVGTWTVSSTGQPSVANAGDTGFRVDASSTGSGIVFTYNNGAGNCITASAEL